jgi:hypothetical protein
MSAVTAAVTPAPAPSRALAGRWEPTQKWWAATILGFGGLLATWSTMGWNWTDALSGAAVTLATQRIVAYLVSN